MKPRKKWEPDYRYGGHKASFFTPPPLGTTNGIVIKPKRPKGKRK